MKYDETKKIVDGIIESEFNHVQMFKERDFTDKDTMQKGLYKTSVELMDKLIETLSEEQKDILNDLDAAICNEWINLLKFYFKEGIAVGLTNLNYLNEIDNISSYL